MPRERKRIIFFSDLEGTLISEDGRFNDEDFFKFISETSKLAQITKADVQLVIASPMGPKYMTMILREMDRRIRTAERNIGTEGYSVDIVHAAADFNDCINDDLSEKYDSRIDPLTTTPGCRASVDNDSKARFVKSVLQAKQAYPDRRPIMYIYSGNGRNDTSAMNIINQLSNGITICPANTLFPETKRAAKINSQFNEARGVAEGIRMIREKFEQRLSGAKPDDNHTQSQTEEIK